MTYYEVKVNLDSYRSEYRESIDNRLQDAYSVLESFGFKRYTGDEGFGVTVPVYLNISVDFEPYTGGGVVLVSLHKRDHSDGTETQVIRYTAIHEGIGTDQYAWIVPASFSEKIVYTALWQFETLGYERELRDE